MLIILIFILILVTLFFIYSFIPSNINKKKFFKRKKNNEKVIYLTFDDGPSKYTHKLLDLLNKYNIKATFFCVGNFAYENKDIIKRMKSEKHLIALHSLKHKNAMLQGIIETKMDLNKSLKLMKNLKVDVKYYRPPWGDSNLCLLKTLKNKRITPVWWDVMAEDWEANTTEKIIAEKILNRTHAGDIVCLHDGRGKNEAPIRTIKALEIALPKFIEEGYEFKTIDEYEF